MCRGHSMRAGATGRTGVRGHTGRKKSWEGPPIRNRLRKALKPESFLETHWKQFPVRSAKQEYWALWGCKPLGPNSLSFGPLFT